MRYQRVDWRHNLADEPVRLFSEIDDDGWEQRKVEEFRDRRLTWAGAAAGTDPTAETVLSETRLPSLDEINRDLQFHAEDISAEEFEAVWRRARAGLPRDIQ